MNTKLLALAVFAVAAGSASAQLTGIRARAGYGWTGAFHDGAGNSHNLHGLTLGADLPFMHLPVVELNLTGDVLFGGSGNVYRGLVTGRFGVPGSGLSVFGGVGYATGIANHGNFANQNGFVGQIGLSMPIAGPMPLLAPSIEAVANLSNKSGLGGFGINLAVRF